MLLPSVFVSLVGSHLHLTGNSSAFAFSKRTEALEQIRPRKRKHDFWQRKHCFQHNFFITFYAVKAGAFSSSIGPEIAFHPRNLGWPKYFGTLQHSKMQLLRWVSPVPPFPAESKSVGLIVLGTLKLVDIWKSPVQTGSSCEHVNYE